jgi:hypothetical protein
MVEIPGGEVIQCDTTVETPGGDVIQCDTTAETPGGKVIQCDTSLETPGGGVRQIEKENWTSLAKICQDYPEERYITGCPCLSPG